MATSKWVLEPAHSELQFKIRHLMITNVTGHFGKIDGAVEMDSDDITSAKVNFSADVDSISTNNEMRDGHLKSGDFFDAAAHPAITFEGTGLTKDSGDDYKMNGNLTMHGVTNPVTLNVEFGGIAKDGYGNTRAGFTVEGKINRKDFGLSYNAATETGGVVLGEEVKVHANIQFVKS